MIWYLLGSALMWVLYGIFYVVTLPFALVDFLASLASINDFFNSIMLQANSFGYYNPPFADLLVWFQFAVGVTLFFFVYRGVRYIIRMVRGA